jgi:E3 ubiquitin-protein ligase UHRF1
LAKNPVNTSAAPAKEYKRIDNESRPDEAFVTERAQKTGRANAASGRIMVTIPNDHFGPIGPEFDPTRKQVW